MKKLITLIMLSAVCLLSGCMGQMTFNNMSRDIAQYELIQTIGVDAAGDAVSVSISSPPGGEDGSPSVLTGTGGTVIGTLEALHNYSSKDRIFYDHTRNYLIGEATAKGDIRGYLDFIERDMNMRLDTALFIVKDSTAADLISETAGERVEISQILNSMQKNIDLLSDGYVFSCGEVATNLAQYGCSLVSAITLAETDGSVSGAGEMTALPAGYGILKDGALIGYIGTDLVGSANIFLDKWMEADILEIPDSTGRLMAFRTTLKTSEFAPVYENGVLQCVNVNIVLSANIDTVGGGVDIYDDAVLAELESKISQLQLEKAARMLQLSQTLDTDFLLIGKKVQLKAPVRFEKMPESWEAIFPALQFNLDVKTTIERTYDMGQPAEVGDHSSGS